MQYPQQLAAFTLITLAAAPAGATDLVACVVASLPNNPSYYGMATTVTRLKCEFTRQDYFPTLGELYKQGWRLIEVVGGERALGQGNQAASPLYFLEREQTPAPAAAPKENPKEGKASAKPSK